MEKIIYDTGVDDCLEIINGRINFYYDFIEYGEADISDIEIIKELETLKDMFTTLKYYRG